MSVGADLPQDNPLRGPLLSKKQDLEKHLDEFHGDVPNSFLLRTSPIYVNGVEHILCSFDFVPGLRAKDVADDDLDIFAATCADLATLRISNFKRLQ